MKRSILFANYILIIWPCTIVISLGMLALLPMAWSAKSIIGIFLAIFLLVVGVFPALALFLLYTDRIFKEIKISETIKNIAKVFANIGATTAIMALAVFFIEYHYKFDPHKYSFVLGELYATLRMCVFGVPLLIPYISLMAVSHYEKCS